MSMMTVAPANPGDVFSGWGHRYIHSAPLSRNGQGFLTHYLIPPHHPRERVEVENEFKPTVLLRKEDML